MRQEPFKSTLDALVPDFHMQEERFARAFALIDGAIARSAFPGATLAVILNHRLVAWKGFGRFTYDAESTVVSPTTIYDIASVTKVVATTTMAMMLYERNRLELEAPVVSVLPEFAMAGEGRREKVTVRMLLAHSSGLPAYVRLFEQAATREELIAMALQTPLAHEPMTRAEYSDIGFIVLGLLLERVAGESSADFCERNIFAPLGMGSTGYGAAEILKTTIAPTVNDKAFRMRVVQGEVHDENASVMGGVAGHAGVFSSSHDVARFAHAMLHGGGKLVRKETVGLFTRRESAPEGTSRAMGWDTPSQPSQSGHYFSSHSFGHLGYTGTSLWCDPERGLSVTLLTNRVWPDCSSKAITQVRPAVHDAIVEALDAK